VILLWLGVIALVPFNLEIIDSGVIAFPGEDGHTASLFADAPNLTEALDLGNTQICMSIELENPPANAPYARITQTLAQILSSRHIVLPLSGADKLQTLQQAWSHATQTLPISFVLQQSRTPLSLWLANEDTLEETSQT
jgi:6-phosphogluconolactonase